MSAPIPAITSRCDCLFDGVDAFVLLIDKICDAVARFFDIVAEAIQTAIEVVWDTCQDVYEWIAPNQNTYGSNSHPSVAINQNSLSQTPLPFDPTNIQYIADNAQPPIQTDEIIGYLQQLFAQSGAQTVLCNDDAAQPITLADAGARIRVGYLAYIEEFLYNRDLYQKLVAESMRLYVIAIIHALRNPELAVEEKQEALKSLARAAMHCAPRRHEELCKVYLSLSHQTETLEQILLQMIQTIKERLILNYYSLSREPVMTLNYIRAQVGATLGLDCHPIHLKDPFINMADARSPDNPIDKHTTPRQFLRVFRRIYTPANLLALMKEALNQRIAQNGDFATMVSQFIDNAVVRLQEAGELTIAEVEKLPEPYQVPLFAQDGTINEVNPYHLTDEGVLFLLVHFGHLVRV